MGSEQSHLRSVDPVTSPSTSTSRHFDPLLSLSRDSIARDRQDSVTSDVESSAEVPYVSYTVNKPIGGDSPKKKSSNLTSLKLTSSSSGNGDRGGAMSRLKFPSRTSAKNTMVVVSTGRDQEDQTDPELKRLKEIPSFLPIMRASLSGSSAKDPDILEKLDFRGLLALTQRYQDHVRICSHEVSSEQTDLTKLIRDVDQKIVGVNQNFSDRQKKLSKHGERLKAVTDMSKCLTRCHVLLNENIEQMEVLNNMLPAEERLEPFVWTTG